ncbi:MAG: TolC family protein [Rikenellaceae bacterium]
MRHLTISLTLTLALVGCSLELTEPNGEVPKEYIFAQETESRYDSIPSKWWYIFRDSTLNDLIDKALTNNKNLLSAIENISIVRSSVATSRAAYLPSLEVEGAATKGNNPADGTFYELSLTPQISWEVSLFGALENTSRASRAEALSSEWGVRASALSLSCEVAKIYFSLLAAQQNLSIAQHSYALRRDATALIDSMTRYGMGNSVAQEQARSLTEQAKSDIFNYTRAFEQYKLSLSLLMGEEPQKDIFVSDNTTLEPLTLNIPSGIPSDLLERRPDILQSRYTMLCNAAKVGIARAERFPSIELTALGGVISEKIEGITSSKNFEWELSASLTQPVFKWYSLKNTEKIARYRYVQSTLTYREQILTALSEVEQALVAISTLDKQTLASREVLRSNTKIAHLTESLYDNGLYNYLNVVDARRELYSSQIAFNEMLTKRHISYIELIKALGGGWQMRD